MKVTILLVACATVLLVVGGIASEASADLLPGQALANSLGATDVWAVTCAAGSASARASVTDLGGVDGRRINVCVANVDGAPGQCKSTDGGATGEAIAVGGPGLYLVTINQAAAPLLFGFESFSLFIRCAGPTGITTLHSHFQIQNQ